jgi:hypothetical protein
LADLSTIFRAATACLVLAFASGLVMAGIRFASDRASPPWLAKLHGFGAAAGLTLLLFGWLNLAGFPPNAVWATLLLLAAAAAGVLLNLAYHWRQRPLPEGLVFAHMSVAFVGLLMVGLEAMSRAG